MMQKSEGLTAQIRPTSICNLRCTYCYASNDARNGKMDNHTLKNAIQKITLFNGLEQATSFIWMGGEPLAAGLEFYKDVVAFQKNLRTQGYRIVNDIQTNGTLLNEEFLNLFERENFSISLSIDGPKHIHDKNRPYLNGRGSFSNILKNLELIKKKGISVQAILTLTKDNFNKIEEIYVLFKEFDLHFSINPVVISGRAKTYRKSIGITAKQYAESMINLFNLWFYDPKPSLNIAAFKSIIENLLEAKPNPDPFQNSCGKFISIDMEGNVTLCARFVEIEHLNFGNINEQDLETILSSLTRKNFADRLNHLPKCLSCKYVNFCAGGCIHNAYSLTESIETEDPYCDGYKMLFSFIEETLNQQLVQTNA